MITMKISWQAVFLATAIAPPAWSQVTDLGVPAYRQDASMWCGAAAMQTVGWWYRRPFAALGSTTYCGDCTPDRQDCDNVTDCQMQCRGIAMALGTSTCTNPSTGTYISQLSNVLKSSTERLQNDIVSGRPSMSTLITQVANNRDTVLFLIGRYQTLNSDGTCGGTRQGGHYMVVTGIDQTYSKLLINDPEWWYSIKPDGNGDLTQGWIANKAWIAYNQTKCGTWGGRVNVKWEAALMNFVKLP
jgi:hypothetical protein